MSRIRSVDPQSSSRRPILAADPPGLGSCDGCLPSITAQDHLMELLLLHVLPRRQESSGATESLGAVPTGFDELEWEEWVKKRGEGAEEIDRSR